jgi:hypothetical protein
VPNSVINTNNLHLGLGQLEVGAYVNGSFVAYRQVGAIRGVLNLAITREIAEFRTGRPLQIVKQEVIRETFAFNFKLSELTVANLKTMLGAGASSSGATPTFMDSTAAAPLGDLSDSFQDVTNADILKLGGSCDLVPLAIRFTHRKVCDGSNTKRQIVEIYKAQFTGTLTLPFNEADWNESEIQFNALADFSRPAGEQILQIVDEQ